jgi:hypothetical protein
VRIRSTRVRPIYRHGCGEYMRLTLGVRDMDILRSFYRTLGWPELPNGDNSWTGFLLGGVLLHHLVPRSVLEIRHCSREP